jgi:hypothetical protein
MDQAASPPRVKPAGRRLTAGASIKCGGLTKAGNSAARRLLIEAAWIYRFPARVSRELRLRQEEQTRAIREIAWKAQLRLCARYRKLASSGEPANVVTAAIARDLAGFIWAIADACRRRLAERNKPVIASQGGASESPDMLPPAGLEARSRSGEPLHPLSAGSPIRRNP